MLSAGSSDHSRLFAAITSVTRQSAGQPRTHRIFTMSLVNLVVTLIVVGVLLWLVNTYIPMDRKIKSILNVVVVIFVVLLILMGSWVLICFVVMCVGG